MVQSFKEAVEEKLLDSLFAKILGSAAVTALIDAVENTWLRAPLEWRVTGALCVALLTYAAFSLVATKWGIHRGEWTFISSAVTIKPTRNKGVFLKGLNETDASIIFSMDITNACGRQITIRAIGGEMNCNGDSGFGR